MGQQAHRTAAPSAGRALVWSLGNTVLARIGTLPVGIVLARLLGPEEFGTFAVAVVALLALLSFNELGVSLAIVRWPDDPDEIAPTVTTISILMSMVMTGMAVATAPWFARAMGAPEATSVVRWMSLCVLLNGIVATPAAVMQRKFRQDHRMLADQVNTWVGALVSIGLALTGVGAMALVAGRLLGASTSSAVFLRFNPLPYRLGLDRTLIRPLLSFGLPLAAASMVAFVAGFLDQLLVGHLLGAVFLGYYVLAFNLASWPVTIFSAPLRMVAPAMFSRRQGDPDRLARDFKRVLRPLAVVALPVCVMLSVASTQVVEIVYGEQWLPAAPIFRWMAIFAAVRIFFELCYDFLVVLGRTKSILLIQVLWIPVLCGCLVVGIRAGGPVGAALSVLVSAIVPLSIYLVELRRAGVAALVLLRTLIPSAVVTGLVAGTTVWLVSAMGSPWLICLSAGSTLTVLLVGALWRLRGDLAVFGAGQDSATGPRGATSLRAEEVTS